MCSWRALRMRIPPGAPRAAPGAPRPRPRAQGAVRLVGAVDESLARDAQTKSSPGALHGRSGGREHEDLRNRCRDRFGDRACDVVVALALVVERAMRLDVREVGTFAARDTAQQLDLRAEVTHELVMWDLEALSPEVRRVAVPRVRADADLEGERETDR